MPCRREGILQARGTSGYVSRFTTPRLPGREAAGSKTRCVTYFLETPDYGCPSSRWVPVYSALLVVAALSLPKYGEFSIATLKQVAISSIRPTPIKLARRRWKSGSACRRVETIRHCLQVHPWLGSKRRHRRNRQPQEGNVARGRGEPATPTN